MNRQALTEALAWWDAQGADLEPEEQAILAAARLVERLLPGECGMPKETVNCPLCDGSGQVWDEGIVETVAQAIWNGMGFVQEIKPVEGSPCFDAARAVLSALAEAQP